MEKSTALTLMIDQMLIGFLALAFAAWAGVVWKGLRRIAEKFDELKRDIMEHLLMIERRLTELEVLSERREAEQKGKKVLELKDLQSK